MDPVLPRILELPKFQELGNLLPGLPPGKPLSLGGLWGASLSLALGALSRREPLAVLAPDDEAGQDIQEDLELFGIPPEEVALFPTLDLDQEGEPDPVTFRERWIALEEIRRGVSLVILPLPALAQPLPSPAFLERHRVLLQTGRPLDLEELLSRAVRAGFQRVPLVAAPGEVSLRGDILDLFPYAAKYPTRVEVLDGEVESLRLFDPETQRSLKALTSREVLLLPGGGGGREGESGESSSLFSWLGREWRGRLLVRVEPGLLAERERSLASSGPEARDLLEEGTRFFSSMRTLALQALPAGEGWDFQVFQVPPPARGEDPLARLESLTMERTLLVFSTEGEKDRLLERMEGPLPPGLETRVGRLSRGFRFPALSFAAFSHDELEGLRPLPRPGKTPDVPARAIRGFFELKKGDLVVHAVHGISRFLGIEAIEKGGAREDHLELEFRDGVRLYVPVSRIDLVQKYVGSGQAAPRLDRLGGKGFSRRKETVRKALLDMAAELLEIQAVRSRSKGIAFPPDDEMQRSFENAFPYKETRDQLKAMEEIKGDMLAPRPMDRLICGDVGFGKTELAMRAAFKAVMGGAQVAILVPTTVLAQQHFETFRSRMADWPVRVEVLSRFRTAREQARIVKETAQGKVDILIGTHRLLSPDISFRNLGLVIVDEEQRFGVAHKEKLKRMRALVDVLTLTATPIPRTLHMSLLGLRDISALTTPPAGREEIATILSPRTPEVIRRGIRKELLRGGQVFFLHNRVQSIGMVERELKSLVPEARIVVGHGQLPERQLEKAMETFVSGKADILLSTSIIESGLDIPRANTIFIDRADRFGLADLHQLRGRVGRYRNKAYAYLLYDPLNPPRGDAAVRLKALEELSGLGAGFAIAMKDLEIRGAGNILGPQQSGHIASVGYDMYCRLLEAASATLRGESPRLMESELEMDLGVPAWIPPEYIPSEALRVEALRSMERAGKEGRPGEAYLELRDRFGPLPGPVKNLLRLFTLKAPLERERIRRFRFDRADRFVARHPPGRPPRGEWVKAFAHVRMVEPGETHLVLPVPRPSPLDALAFLEKALGLPSPRLWEEEGRERMRRHEA